MNTLQNQTLLYDNDCPLCKVYTKGFIKTNMLDENGRKPFNQLSDKEQHFIDVKRATNEIALVDTKNRTVIYGIDSLLKVIGNSFPIIEKIGHFNPIHFLLKKLYSFISYNRKVIIPNKRKKESELQCVPDFNYKYRILYIILTTLITTLILFKFSNLITISHKSSVSREFILACGQIIFQGEFIAKFNNKTILNYIGNLMTVSLLGSLILIPILILNSILNISEFVTLVWFGLTVLIMFLEHKRRTKILELPNYLTYTWVLYRIIALTFILNL